MTRATRLPSPAPPRPPAGTRGFTLVEVLVAFLLLAVVATVVTLVSGSAVQAFARTETATAALQQLERTRALLASDLGQAAPRLSLGQSGDRLQAFTLTPSGFVLVRGGVTGVPARVQKIAWGHDGRNLLRQSWPAVDGSAPSTPDVMLAAIREVRVRVDAGQGFADRWEPREPQALPRAVELTLVPEGRPPVVLLFLVAA
ncbi:MAG: type II secretion system protein GspJ [Thermaurantiacus tibetensis]|uniref:type II secretion system protein GspJ n=1 Tax=Thermaurantiacus tibetensis TaxID=2759035 RepID=UPI00188FE7C5|nr:type II secretion system protein GspJ [Thermaurantiacus tibetensis]